MGEWINAAEAAQRLGVKQATLYAYVSRGMLARRRGEDGRSSLFEADEVACLAERAQRGSPRRAAGTGDFVIESELTEVADGRIRYRGMEVTKLALWRPFEEVAAWLWTGGLGQDGASQPWQATPEAVAVGAGAQAALPEGTLPLERLRVIVPAMAASDPLRLHLDPPAVIEAGRTIIAGMIDCLPDAGSTGGTLHTSPCVPSARLAEGGIAGRFWYKICPKRPDPGLLGALRAAMALLADHELAASTFAARMAASVRADPYAVVATGLGALGGALHANPRHAVAHGGASLAAETMLAAAREPADAVRVVGDLLRRGERIPGLGDFHHAGHGAGGVGADPSHQADPRARALLDLTRKAAPRSARYAVADAVLVETRRRALPEPNIDFALATLVNVAGMIPGAGEAIFAVARTAGWIAHALEEYARSAPLRPRTVYTGPGPKTPQGTVEPPNAARTPKRTPEPRPVPTPSAAPVPN
jgi:citrate synthase